MNLPPTSALNRNTLGAYSPQTPCCGELYAGRLVIRRERGG
jgi:hypothetical protein